MKQRHSNSGYVAEASYHEAQGLVSVSGGFCNIMFFNFNPKGSKELHPQITIKFLKPEVSVHWLVREMYVLKRLKHPNILTYIGHTCHEKFGYGLLLEFMECGDLHNTIVNLDVKYSWEQIGSWSGQILLALDYLEVKRIVHSDLNLKNVLMANDSQLVKLADFGSARNTNERIITENMFSFFNPSSFTGEQLSCKTDIFAFGMILWWMIHRRNPFSGFDSIECNFLLVTGVRPRTEENHEIEQICQSCWQDDPNQRKSASEILYQFYFRQN